MGRKKTTRYPIQLLENTAVFAKLSWIRDKAVVQDDVPSWEEAKKEYMDEAAMYQKGDPTDGPILEEWEVDQIMALIK